MDMLTLERAGIKASDLRVDSFVGGDAQVTIIHLPSCTIGRGQATSQIRAYDQALFALVEALTEKGLMSSQFQIPEEPETQRARIRRETATACLQGLLAQHDSGDTMVWSHEDAARHAIRYCNALLAELEK